MRWVVGDLHGCAQELNVLMALIRFDPKRDELFAVGDLVNTGPRSLDVLRRWRDLGGRAVLGNHDLHALGVYDGTRKRRSKDTLDELLEAPDVDELLDALRSQPVLAFLPSAGEGPDAWVVHAGLDPRWTDLHEVARRLAGVTHDASGLQSPWIQFATRVRCCTADGEMVQYPGPPESCPDGFRPWDVFYRGETLVIHGHWAWRGHYRGERTMGLDSGCVYGRGLTAWCQDEDRIVHVPGSLTGGTGTTA